jgi:Spy/CpxP family protein refolding chaperone
MQTGSKRDWQVRLAALVIFVLGFAAGALALTAYRGSGGASSGRSRHHFGEVLDQLGLSDDQRAQVKAIFGDARGQMSEVRKECGPKFREVRERADARLQQVMTPEQWEKFKSLTAESDERRRRRRGGGDHDHDEGREHEH